MNKLHDKWQLAKENAKNVATDFVDLDKWKTIATDKLEGELSSRIDAISSDLERLYYGNLQNFTIDNLVNKALDTLPLTGKFGSQTIQNWPAMQLDTKPIKGLIL
jgi:peptidoglycan hydrolase-like protein with peptidoglycan-binding domain